MAISGRTKVIAHLGYPTESFKAPMIYNPYFERHDIDAVVVPMGCKAEDYAAFCARAGCWQVHGRSWSAAEASALPSWPRWQRPGWRSLPCSTPTLHQ